MTETNTNDEFAEGPAAEAEAVTEDPAAAEESEAQAGVDPAGSPAGAEPPVAGGAVVEPEGEALKRVQGELDELRDRHARLAAEFDNYRKRMARENQALYERAQAALALKILEVLDDLDRIIDGIDENTPAESLNEALVLVDRKLRKELEAAGLERIDPAGAAFDPAEHEAIAATPAPSPDQEQQVSATFQAGYRFRGSLIRPARVQVFTDPGQA